MVYSKRTRRTNGHAHLGAQLSGCLTLDSSICSASPNLYLDPRLFRSMKLTFNSLSTNLSVTSYDLSIFQTNLEGFLDKRRITTDVWKIDAVFKQKLVDWKSFVCSDRNKLSGDGLPQTPCCRAIAQLCEYLEI